MLGYCTCLSFFSPKKAMPISVISPVGYFYFIFLTIYNYQLLKAFPTNHLENSSAQWAIFLIQNLSFFGGGERSTQCYTYKLLQSFPQKHL